MSILIIKGETSHNLHRSMTAVTSQKSDNEIRGPPSGKGVTFPVRGLTARSLEGFDWEAW